MKETRIKVLYIDDEPHNLAAFKAAFRRDYDIVLAESASDARAILEREEVPVILSDQRMPGETGIEFFESIKSLYPHSMRILLTGYADIQAVISAVNLGNIFRYLQKPWDEEEIRKVILEAFDIYDSRQQVFRKNLELEKAYQELDRFVYSASHDMRAPLMSILGILQLAKMDKETSSADYFTMIEESVLKLDVFIRNIIQYYKNNRFDANRQALDWKALIEECVEANRYQLGDVGIDFEVEVAQNGDFFSDDLKVRLVLNNLLSNAIKYSPENPRIRISLFSDAQSATLKVRDNGSGITESEQDQVFKMFFRGTHPKSGSGLGLYIVRDAVTRLDGSISLQSEPGQGTEFTVVIPNQA
jgi:two-component system, sensor histidine kinase and response regulator